MELNAITKKIFDRTLCGQILCTDFRLSNTQVYHTWTLVNSGHLLRGVPACDKYTKFLRRRVRMDSLSFNVKGA